MNGLIENQAGLTQMELWPKQFLLIQNSIFYLKIAL